MNMIENKHLIGNVEHSPEVFLVVDTPETIIIKSLENKIYFESFSKLRKSCLGKNKI